VNSYERPLAASNVSARLAVRFPALFMTVVVAGVTPVIRVDATAPSCLVVNVRNAT
jgi:hypothetical protein